MRKYSIQEIDDLRQVLIDRLRYSEPVYKSGPQTFHNDGTVSFGMVKTDLGYDPVRVEDQLRTYMLAGKTGADFGGK